MYSREAGMEVPSAATRRVVVILLEGQARAGKPAVAGHLHAAAQD